MKKVFSILFSVLILSLFVMVAVRFADKISEEIGDGEKSGASWSAKAEYPFSDLSETEKATNVKNLSLSKIQSIIKSAEDKIENGVTTSGYYYQDLVILTKYIDKFCGMYCTTSNNEGKNSLDNSADVVLELDNGYLAYIMDDVDISENIDAVADFGKDMELRGISFLYLETPYKLNKDDAGYDKYASVYPSFFEEKTTEIRERLEAESLRVVTLDKYLPELDTDRMSLFFKTDHHWLPQTGLRACEALCDALNSECGYDIDTSVFDIDNYEVTKDVLWLGSQGRRVTEVYADPEYLPVLMPKYDTSLDVFISETNKTTTGSIQETLFDNRKLIVENYYKSGAYAFYGFGDQKCIKVHNNLVSNGKRLLIIKKSFADCMVPFLAGVVEDMFVIDLRYFDGSLQTFIEKEKPDTVVIIYGTASYEVESDNRMAFDFR